MTQFGVFLCAEQQKTYRRKVSWLDDRRVGGCWRSVSSSAVNSAFSVPLLLLVRCWLLRALHVSVGLTGNCAFTGIDKRARVAILHYIENLIKFEIVRVVYAPDHRNVAGYLRVKMGRVEC